MCKLLNISRKMIYYKYKNIKNKLDIVIEDKIIKIFNKNYKSYGTRRIKIELKKLNIVASRIKISQIMKKYNLITKYILKYKNYKSNKYNEENNINIVKRNFNNKNRLNTVASDLTYVKVGSKWNYICIIIDLFNREIISYAIGENKDSELVLKTLKSIKYPINRIKILYIDRRLEFKNSKLEKIMKIFNIKYSLSRKGCPYDNAKTIKTEFIFNNKFKNIE